MKRCNNINLPNNKKKGQKHPFASLDWIVDVQAFNYQQKKIIFFIEAVLITRTHWAWFQGQQWRFEDGDICLLEGFESSESNNDGRCSNIG